MRKVLCFLWITVYGIAQISDFCGLDSLNGSFTLTQTCDIIPDIHATCSDSLLGQYNQFFHVDSNSVKSRFGLILFFHRVTMGKGILM